MASLSPSGCISPEMGHQVARKPFVCLQAAFETERLTGKVELLLVMTGYSFRQEGSATGECLGDSRAG